MRPARIILIVVALLAGGLAAWLATRGGTPTPAPEVVEVVQSPTTKVLVAKDAIGVAERLTEENTEWLDWPENAVRPDYVTIAAMPDAQTALAGSVARFEFFPGEPIRDIKLVKTNQGYLSAVLEPGKRGVSFSVTDVTASGGFIVPNDKVDVVLTQEVNDTEVSQTLLSNVKVLALGTRLGEVGATGAPADPENPRAEQFAGATIATVELTPAEAEILINASQVGSLSLVLRSVADFNDKPGDMVQASNQTVKVIRYGNETAVMTGSTSTGSQTAAAAPATIDPASYTPPSSTSAAPAPGAIDTRAPTDPGTVE
jgi:pilus assembly protein CpaB